MLTIYKAPLPLGLDEFWCSATHCLLWLNSKRNEVSRSCDYLKANKVNKYSPVCLETSFFSSRIPGNRFIPIHHLLSLMERLSAQTSPTSTSSLVCLRTWLLSPRIPKAETYQSWAVHHVFSHVRNCNHSCRCLIFHFTDMKSIQLDPVNGLDTIDGDTIERLSGIQDSMVLFHWCAMTTEIARIWWHGTLYRWIIISGSFLCAVYFGELFQ